MASKLNEKRQEPQEMMAESEHHARKLNHAQSMKAGSSRKNEVYKTTPVLVSHQKLRQFENDEETQRLLKRVTPDQELLLANLNLETVPVPLRTQGNPFFQNLLVLDLNNNEIVEVDGVFC
jgi:hypothetical protein